MPILEFSSMKEHNIFLPQLILLFAAVFLLSACDGKGRGDALRAGDSLPDVRGTMHPVLASGQATLVLFVDAHCGACRLRVGEYRWLQKQADTLVAVARVILLNDLSVAAQFERLLDLDVRVMLDEDALYFRKFEITTVPTLIVFGSDGTVIRRWSPWEPGLRAGIRQ